jgi:hypothetical protein
MLDDFLPEDAIFRQIPNVFSISVSRHGSPLSRC